MQFIPIKTRPFLPPQDNIFSLFNEYLPPLQENDILFITSKILAIHQGRCIPIENISKQALIKQEADQRIASDVVPGKDIYLTIKHHTLIPSAGIDESNAKGHYILRPEQLNEDCKQIFTYLCQKFHLNHLGIIITDSTTKPLRW
ncbi:MAG: hypothetical protein LBP53_07675 [Candidatus Peribacteria bacterium]|jgi:F420-0:gamma-glutamyl ligase|nr:hypothetical protein [Candidatus Peribacteria bacterium]